MGRHHQQGAGTLNSFDISGRIGHIEQTGRTLKLGGFIRAGKYGIDLVVTRHEPIEKLEVQDGPAPEAEVAPAIEPAAQAPKAKGRGRKKAA